MTDFRMQQRLRELNTPRFPRDDLWPAIASRIDDARVRSSVLRRHGTGWPLAAAAILILALAGTLPVMLSRHGVLLQRTTTGKTRPVHEASATRTPAQAPEVDPRLLGATLVLDSAHAELEQALEQRPDAVFLVGLLNRTQAQRQGLDRFGPGAG